MFPTYVIAALVGLLAIVTPVLGDTQIAPASVAVEGKHYLELAWQSSSGVLKMLRRAQAFNNPGAEPIPVFLHGVDIEIFSRENYSRYRAIVDLARQLELEGKIELRACRLALHRKFDRIEDIDPVIELVPYVPQAIQDLHDQGYRPLP